MSRLLKFGQKQAISNGFFCPEIYKKNITSLLMNVEKPSLLMNVGKQFLELFKHNHKLHFLQ